MKRRSKRYKLILKSSQKGKKIDTKEIFELVKKNSTLKFDESIDVSLRINLKQTKGGDFSLRTTVNLPNGSGKKNKIAVLCEADKVDEAKKAGADITGSDDLIEKYKDGNIDFDVAITTPDQMKNVSKLAKVLGPKGLMPSPKSGTVTENIDKAVKEIKHGQVRFKAEQEGIVQGTIANVSMKKAQLKENFDSFINELKRLKPASSKGIYFKSVFLSTTMGPGYRIDTSQF